MKRIILTAFLLLIGCAHQLELISRDNSGNGTGNAQEAGKQITINVSGKTYRGTYVYDGGRAVTTVSSANATAYSGSRTAHAYGNGFSSTYIPGSGNGRILATSGDDSIRCDFTYEHGSGIGYCQDNSGKEYDLLIH